MKVCLFWAASVALSATDAPRGPEAPELNRKVLEFARDNVGRKVGDGECATLAAEALRAAGAKGLSTGRDGEYVWGRLVRAVTPGGKTAGDVLPGDVLQFRDAVLAGRVGRSTVESTYRHHTAVVAAVKQDGKVVEVLHQNYAGPGDDDEARLKVRRTTLRLGELKRGWVKVYRPTPDGE